MIPVSKLDEADPEGQMTSFPRSWAKHRKLFDLSKVRTHGDMKEAIGSWITEQEQADKCKYAACILNPDGSFTELE